MGYEASLCVCCMLYVLVVCFPYARYLSSVYVVLLLKSKRIKKIVCAFALCDLHQFSWHDIRGAHCRRLAFADDMDDGAVCLMACCRLSNTFSVWWRLHRVNEKSRSNESRVYASALVALCVCLSVCECRLFEKCLLKRKVYANLFYRIVRNQRHRQHCLAYTTVCVERRVLSTLSVCICIATLSLLEFVGADDATAGRN